MQLVFYGNNKQKLEIWKHWLTQIYTFAESGKIEAKKDRQKGEAKYELLLEVASDEAANWLAENFNANLHPPYKDFAEIAKFKRPLKLVKLEPVWRVHCNLELRDRYSGLEEKARAKFEELKKDPKIFGMELCCDELAIREEYRRGKMSEDAKAEAEIEGREENAKEAWLESIL